jgi:hypothetical protein
LRTSDRRINTQLADFLVGWRLPTVAVDRSNDGVKIVEYGSPTLTLCGYPDAKITSCPPTVRVFQQTDFSGWSVRLARISSCHTSL